MISVSITDVIFFLENDTNNLYYIKDIILTGNG